MLEIVSATDPGMVRSHNEDSIAADAELGLAVLADGMGGYNAGEVASGIAVAMLTTEMKQALQEQDPHKLVDGTGEPLAAALVRYAVRGAVFVHALCAVHAQLRLERPGPVVDAGMDDPAVMPGLVRRELLLFFEEGEAGGIFLAAGFVDEVCVVSSRTAASRGRENEIVVDGLNGFG